MVANTGLLDPTSLQGSALRLRIVQVLEQFGKPLPVDFVARTLGRQTPEILPEIEDLQNRGALTFSDDEVRLGRL